MNAYNDKSSLLTSPIGRTLIRLATPNIIAMFIMQSAVIFEVWYVGQLGINALAGLTLVFPIIMINLMLSGGSIGGAISGIIAQKLGAGDRVEAERLSLHAIILSISIGVILQFLFLYGGPWFYSLLGGKGIVLEQALEYSNMFFYGCIGVWLANILSAIVRATGHMNVAAIGFVSVAICQVFFSGVFVFGLGPFPKLGIAGAALGIVIGHTFSIIIYIYFLIIQCPELRLNFSGIRIRFETIIYLLKLSALSSVSPITSIGVVIIITAYMAFLGPEYLAGYGIGVRLEFILIPLIFGFGSASITMIGIHFGAQKYTRGLRVGWIAAGFSFIISGIIGIVVSLFPYIWTDLFYNNESVTLICKLYLQIVGPFYAFFGLGQALYFASQGAGKMQWPVIASLIRFTTIFLGTLYLSYINIFSVVAIFWLISLSLFLYALVTTIAIWKGAWNKDNLISIK